MSDDLRRAIRAAARSVPIRLGPAALDIAQRGGPIYLNGGETGQLVDAVMAVLDEAFPPRQFLDPAPQMRLEDVAAWYVAWAEVLGGDAQMRMTVLPPDAAAIYRRTPEQRRAYLIDHRDEALANGIPADLIDMILASSPQSELGDSDYA